MFLRGSKALCLVNRNHIGDFLSGIEEAACPGARLDILVHLRADTTVLHGWMFLHIFPDLGPTLFVTALSACPITYYNLPTSDLSKKNLHICEAYVIMRSRLQLPKIVV